MLRTKEGTPVLSHLCEAYAVDLDFDLAAGEPNGCRRVNLLDRIAWLDDAAGDNVDFVDSLLNPLTRINKLYSKDMLRERGIDGLLKDATEAGQRFAEEANAALAEYRALPSCTCSER